MKKTTNRVDLSLILALYVGLLASAHLAVIQKINWDEFYYLSQVHDYGRGTLTIALQTIHVHFWAPLIGSDLNEVSQIVIGRLVMWLCLSGTVIAIYVIARAFFSRSAAMFAGLVYLSFNYVLIHGTSFRTDPSAAFLMMVCLAIAVRAKLTPWSILLFSVCAALAALTTIKVVFYVPAFLAAVVWRLSQDESKKRVLVSIAVMLVLSLVLFGAVFLLHRNTLTVEGLDGSKSMLSNAAKTTLTKSGLFVSFSYLLSNSLYSLIPTFVMLSSAALLVLRGRALVGSRLGAGIVLGLALPLVTFTFYRNTFPYYFPFIFPPAMIIAASLFESLKRRSSLQIVLVGLCVVTIAQSWLARLPETKAHQNATVQAAHDIFPEPVAYFDRSGTLGTFPKANIFMSTWGLTNYQSAGFPQFKLVLEKKPVPLLLLNSPQLTHAVMDGVAPIFLPFFLPLFEEDREVLASNYIPHWGLIWVAGKSLALTNVAQDVEFAIPGSYTLESEEPIRVGSREVVPNETVAFERGSALLSSTAPQDVILRWAAATYVPSEEAPVKPFFTDF